MNIFLFDWIDEEIRLTLIEILGYDLYQFRPLQKLLSTGWHVISFYLVLATLFMTIVNLLEYLWQISF